MNKAVASKSIVLYADDDPDDLKLVQDSFSRYTDKVEVITAHDGTQAMAYLNNLSNSEPTPCLIILDINMPRMNGKQVLFTLRHKARFEEVPIILFTTSCSALDTLFAQKYKAGFITKPIDYQKMEKIAEEFLEHCSEEVKKKILETK